MRPDSICLQNGCIRAVFQIRDHKLTEIYSACMGEKDGEPLYGEILRNGQQTGSGSIRLASEPDSGNRRYVAFDYSGHALQAALDNNPRWHVPPEVEPGPRIPCGEIRYSRMKLSSRRNRQTVSIRGIGPQGEEISKRISLGPDDTVFHVQVSLSSRRELLLEQLDDHFAFTAGKPDFTWLPQVKYGEENICADWSWKSPAAVIQRGSRLAAIVPDVRVLAETGVLSVCNAVLDLDVRTAPSATLSCGLVPAYPHLHSLFRHVPGQRAVVPKGGITFAYYLLLASDVPDREGYRQVTHFLWERFGRGNLMDGHSAQNGTFAYWAEKTWGEYADRVWMEFDYQGKPCGSLRCLNFRMEEDGWFCGWWNNMRTAYGLELYARRSGNRKARERAERILNLALSAPRTEGAFPVLFQWNGGVPVWIRDHGFGGYPECFHTFDMSWTGYWLLRWHRDLYPGDHRILPLCKAYGDFLLRFQRGDGFIPSYFQEDLSLKKDVRLNREGAEPAACALFLSELYCVLAERSGGDSAAPPGDMPDQAPSAYSSEDYLAAAVKAMGYIVREIVPQAKWFDYETFLSCSPKAYDFYDPITDQQPQNNMGTIQAAKALLNLYRITEEESHLYWGRRVLDYLSLTQQVWSHPRLTPNLIGGFTTQNSDAEWSDARQAHCAVLYLDYFQETGEREYLERGIAALRASFPVAPGENWAHFGYADVMGAASGFHWGQGSGMASVEMVWDRYGDVFLDIGGGWGIGVNGCTVSACKISGDVISLSVQSDLQWEEPFRIVGRNPVKDSYALTINHRSAGRFSSAQLGDGISVEMVFL